MLKCHFKQIHTDIKRVISTSWHIDLNINLKKKNAVSAKSIVHSQNKLGSSKHLSLLAQNATNQIKWDSIVPMDLP